MNIFWILIALYFISGIRNYKYRNQFLYSAMIWMFATSTKYIPDLLVYGLEKQYKALVLDNNFGKNTVYIHVLGGGSTNDVDIAPQERLSQNSLARMSEGIRIYKELEGSKLIFSGYSSTNNVTQAAVTRDAAIAIGIPNEDIIILETPSTTEEEAISFKSILGNSNPKLILVTSDIHMPRAMYLFKKHGLEPIAAPSDHILKRHYAKDNAINSVDISTPSISKDSFWWKSNRNNFDKFYSAMHEYIGLLWA